MSYTKDQLKIAVKSKGYVWFEGEKDYDLNMVGVRNSTPGKKVTNIFDDFITLTYRVDGEWITHTWAATTDPGKKALLEPTTGGTAILVPGQYRSSHTIRLHQGKYEAMCQQNPVRVYRDADRDMEYDTAKITEGIYGINIHRSNPLTESTYVESWSAGCSVFKRVKDFKEFMVICNKAKDIHGNSFTYTLIESKDIK